MRFHTGISWLIATNISIELFKGFSAAHWGKGKKKSVLEGASVNDVSNRLHSAGLFLWNCQHAP